MMLKKEDLVGKTFSEVICLLGPETSIVVGEEGRSGFIYFGKAKNAIEELYTLRNEYLTKAAEELKNNRLAKLRKSFLKRRIRSLEDFDIINSEVTDVFNKTQDVDIGILISDCYLLPSFWCIEEFEKKTCFSGPSNSIENVYARFPDLVGAFDIINI